MPFWSALATGAHGAPGDEALQEEEAGEQAAPGDPGRDAGRRRPLQEEEAGEQAAPADALLEELGRALGMTPAEVAALGLSPAEMQGLLAGFTEETVVVGSRAEARSATESAVPVDVLTATDLGRQGAGDLKDQLRTVIPSFNVNTQPIGGASTVVRPAMLRNLAPDHTLILVNGKRRHRASIIDWHGGNGVAYGSQAPDIFTIPAIALRQVEVLRDGAAAQYGSDAIAGVMNFQLKDAASGGSLELDSGMFGGGDGESYRLAGNVGLPLGARGFANLSLQYGESNPTNRAAPRRDAIALIAAGNTSVASEAPQIWGAPDVEDDLTLFGNFGYGLPSGVELYAHANYASKKVTGGFFFRNPNVQRGIYSNDNGRTLLIGDARAARGEGSASCPTVAVTDDRPDSVALQRVLDDPDCFSVREIYPGGYTPRMGGTAADTAIVGGVRGGAGGFGWDVSGSLGVHDSHLFSYETVNASLGPDTPTSFDLGTNRQREINLNADVSYAVADRVNVAAGVEWRDEQFGAGLGDPASWAVGPLHEQGFFAGAHGFPGYGPLAVGEWSRSNFAAYGDLEVSGDAGGGWTLGGAVRAERFEDFGSTTNGKLSGRAGFVRGSVSTAFRAPTPGQQQGFNLSSWFDPSVGYLIIKAVIPPSSPAARLRGGAPLGPEESLNYTAGVVLDSGSFTFTADYFRIDVSDRIGVTSIFTLTDTEVGDLLAEGVESARDLRYFQFFHQRLRHDDARDRRGLDLDAARAAREYRHQRRLQPHAHPGHRQREGTAERPAHHRVRLRAPPHPLERRRDATHGPDQSAGPRELLRRLVRLRQRAQPHDRHLRPRGRPLQRVLRGPADRRPGAEHRSRARHDPGHRGAERVQHLFAGLGVRHGRRRAVQRVHAVGLQRRLLLRANRLRLGGLTADGSGRTGNARRDGGRG